MCIANWFEISSIVLLGEVSSYTLEFKKISIPRISHEDVSMEQSEVDVLLDSSSGTWDMSSEKRVLEFKKLLSRRNVHVTKSQFYASVKLSQTPTEDERRQKALSKLTDEERKLLGL